MDLLTHATADRARRVGIQHAIAQTADRLMSGTSTLAHLDDHERLVRLMENVGAACTSVGANEGVELDECLLHIAAETQTWLEARARNGALS